MAERPRIYQLRFDDRFRPAPSQEVTPFNFSGSTLFGPEASPAIRIPSLETPARFVREVSERIQVTWPGEAAQYLVEQVYTPFDAFDQEELHVLLLNNKNYCTHTAMVYRGTINAVFVRPSEVVREAVRLNAAGLVLSHNHTSGDPTPSPNDIAISRRVKLAADILDLRFLDHIIVGQERWVSMIQEGISFD